MKYLFIVLTIILSLTGCDILDTLSDNQGRVDVIVSNNTLNVISAVYISPSNSNSWGPNRLGISSISSNSNFTITNVPCGHDYDYRLMTGNGLCSYLFDDNLSCVNNYNISIESLGACTH